MSWCRRERECDTIPLISLLIGLTMFSICAIDVCLECDLIVCMPSRCGNGIQIFAREIQEKMSILVVQDSKNFYHPNLCPLVSGSPLTFCQWGESKPTYILLAIIDIITTH